MYFLIFNSLAFKFFYSSFFILCNILITSTIGSKSNSDLPINTLLILDLSK
jgi:hypothetical protein